MDIANQGQPSKEIDRYDVQGRVDSALDLLEPITRVILYGGTESEEVSELFRRVIEANGQQFLEDVITAMRRIDAMAEEGIADNRASLGPEPNDEQLRIIIWACQNYYRNKRYKDAVVKVA